jgi:hypothetical protein
MVRDLDPFGRTLHADAQINVRSTQAPPAMRDTVLHEVLHAILWVSGLAFNEQMSEETEERIIRNLTPWLLDLLRKNPKLITYLLEK